MTDQGFLIAYKFLIEGIEDTFSIELRLCEKVALWHILEYVQQVCYQRSLSDGYGVSQTGEATALWLRDYGINYYDWKDFDNPALQEYVRRRREECLVP